MLAEQWQHQLQESPEFATIVGDYRYNDRWSDISLAHVAQQKKDAEGFLAPARTRQWDREPKVRMMA